MLHKLYSIDIADKNSNYSVLFKKEMVLEKGLCKIAYML